MPARRLPVGVSVAPALARLVLVLGRVESLEHARLLDRGSVRSAVDRGVDGGGQRSEPVDLAPDQLALTFERGQAIVARIVEQRHDLHQREPELAPDQDLLKSLEVLV